jgi:hypothetical protein
MKNPKTRIGYKVVSRWNDKYYSWTASPDDYECVEYVIGKTTKPRPRCGPLCVLPTLERAKKFIDPDIDANINDVILKVRFVPSKEKRAWTPSTSASKDDLSDDTILADSVTPIQVIK